MFESFTVIPSIDIKGGAVVRLLRGDMQHPTTYGKDAARIARSFELQGARLIHVVDLDGAASGVPRHLDSVRAIRAAVKCDLDFGGGLRTIQSVRNAAAAGANWVSIGSAAFLAPELLGAAAREMKGRVFGSIDLREDKVAIKGWSESSELSASEAAERFREAGVAAVTVTDIARDGTQVGVDAQAIAAMARELRIPVIASGGVASLADIAVLRARFDDGVVGVIVGRALYEGRFTLADAIAAAA